MARTLEYQKLLAELATGEIDDIERKILDALQQAPKGLTRQGLIRIVFREEPQRNLSNDTRDRKVRKAIESLRDKLIPIVSSSGEPGYRLETNPEVVEAMVREWESRIDHLEKKVMLARQYYGLTDCPRVKREE